MWGPFRVSRLRAAHAPISRFEHTTGRADGSICHYSMNRSERSASCLQSSTGPALSCEEQPVPFCACSLLNQSPHCAMGCVLCVIHPPVCKGALSIRDRTLDRRLGGGSEVRCGHCGVRHIRGTCTAAGATLHILRARGTALAAWWARQARRALRAWRAWLRRRLHGAIVQ